MKLKILIFIFISTSLHANPFMQFSLDKRDFNEEMSKTTYSLKLDRQAVNPLWNYAKEDKQISNVALSYVENSYEDLIGSNEFKLQSLALSWEKYLNNKYFISLTPSLHKLELTSEKKMLRHIDSRFMYINGQTSWELILSRKYVGLSSPRSAAFTNSITQHFRQLNYYRYTDTQRIKLSYLDNNISDKNKRRESNLDWMFPFLKEHLQWFWFGYRWNHIEHTEESSNYWSPRRLSAHILKIELSQNFGKENQWKLSSSASYGTSKENDLDWQEAKGLYIEIAYGLRDSNQLSISYGDYDSRTWKEQGHRINYQLFF